jgi:chloramphenicol-sensitive protein RarD
VAAVAAFVIWGLLTVYWKSLEHFNAFELVAQRIVWSSVLLAIIVTMSSSWRTLAALPASDKWRIGLAGGLITVNWTCYVYAVVHGRVIETALGYFMSPIALVGIGIAVLGERIRRAQIAAIALAATAVVVITLSYGRFPIFAVLIMASWSSYALLKRRVPLSATQSLTGETLAMLLPAVVVLIVLGARRSSIPHTADGWHVALVALSGVATVVPLTLFARAAKRVPFTVLGPLQYIIPTINFLLSVFAYHERLNAAKMAGFVLVWVGLAVFTVDNIRSANERAGGGGSAGDSVAATGDMAPATLGTT